MMSTGEISRMQKTQAQLKDKITAKQTVKKQVDPVQIAIKQLELRVTDQDDKKQVSKILFQILQYPSSQWAQLHQASNRLGYRDEQQEKASQKRQQQMAESEVRCPCCGFVKQEDQLKLCHKLDDIMNLGLSTFLYFQTIKNLAIVLIEMLLIYSIFAFASNIVASGKFSACGQTGYAACSSNLDYLAISLGSKQKFPTTENQTFYYVQCWLGIGMVVIWFITFAALKYYQKLKQIEVDIQTRSASDFTIVVENIPESFTQAQFQAQLTQYEKKVFQIASIPKSLKKPLVIQKFNKGKPFYRNEAQFDDKQLKELQQKQMQLKQKFVEWIFQRQDSRSFSLTKEQREQVYKQYEKNLESQKKKLEQLGQKMKQKMKDQSSEQNTVIFVTLDSDIAKNLITTLNPTDYSSRVRNFITCSTLSHKFELKHNDKVLDIKIQRSPEPEDIVWANIGLSDWQKLKRKIITYVVTFIILGASFGAVVGLSYAQINNASNQYLSILISIIISLINVVLSQSIRFLSIFQRDYTTIKYQTSLAIKSVVGQLLNSILVPIFSNYFIKNNLYDKNGLADDIFMLGITNAFITPILKIVDGGYIFSKIMIWFYNRPGKKIHYNQIQFNALFTNIEFQIGYQYIYVVNLFLFVCFFVSLQPIICLFAIVGYLMMYWAQKWSLFNRCRRPVPGNDLINSAMGQIIFLGPVVYSLGSLAWSNFFPDGTPKYALLPNLIALGISVFMLVFPLSIIFASCRQDSSQAELKYEENRIFLPSQYDRLNPATAQEGFKDYEEYKKRFLQGMKGKSKQQQAKLAQLLMKNQRPPAQQSMPFPQPMNFFAPSPMMPSYQQSQFFPSMMPMNSGFGFSQFNSPYSNPYMNQQMFNPVFQPPPMIIPTYHPQPQIQPTFQPPIQQQNIIGFGNQPPQQVPFRQPQQQPQFQQPQFQQPQFQQPQFQQPQFPQQGGFIPNQGGFNQGNFGNNGSTNPFNNGFGF